MVLAIMTADEQRRRTARHMERVMRTCTMLVKRKMVVRNAIWLTLTLALGASPGVLPAQQWGQSEMELSSVEVENVVQDEPANDWLELREPDQGEASELEPSVLEDLADKAGDSRVDHVAADSSSERLKESTDATKRPQEKKSDAERRLETTRLQLAKLRRPLKQLELNGLESVSSATSRADVFGVSSDDSVSPALNSALNSESRWITSTVAGVGSPTAEETRYARRRLYFEDSSLERCGQSDGYLRPGIWTNGKSAAKFLLDTTLLPYRMLRQRPDQLVSARAK